MENCSIASLWRRAVAWWIDLLIISIPLCIWIIGVWSDIGGRYRVESWYQEYLWQDWLPWAWLLGVFLYYCVSEAVWSATLGKRLMRIKVVKTDGSVCDWYASVVRNLLRFFDGLFFWWIGAVFAITTKKRQRIGDLLAKTVVVGKF